MLRRPSPFVLAFVITCLLWFTAARPIIALASPAALPSIQAGALAERSALWGWLIPALAILGLGALSAVSGWVVASVAQVGGLASIVPAAVGGVGVGVTFFLGGAVAAATGDAGTGGTVPIPPALAIAQFAGAAFALALLVVAGILGSRWLRSRFRGGPSPLGGVVGGWLGLGIALIAFGAASSFDLVVANQFTGEVSMVDVTSLLGTGTPGSGDPIVVDSVVPMDTGATLPFVSTMEEIERTATASAPSAGGMAGGSCHSLGEFENDLSRQTVAHLVFKGIELARRLPSTSNGWADREPTLTKADLASPQLRLNGAILDEADLAEALTGAFAEGSDLSLVIELSPQPDPPGNARWVLRIASAGGQNVLADGAGARSGTGPGPGPFNDTYVASLQAQQLDANTGEWQPVCEDLIFTLSAEATPEPGPQPGASPQVTVLQPARCRSGPGAVYPTLIYFAQDTVLPVAGRSRIDGWWVVSYSGRPGQCWLGDAVVELTGDASGVPILADPPTPTPTEPPPSRQQGCLINGVCYPWKCGTKPNDPPNAPPCSY
jgi:hypothetical protein